MGCRTLLWLSIMITDLALVHLGFFFFFAVKRSENSCGVGGSYSGVGYFSYDSPYIEVDCSQSEKHRLRLIAVAAHTSSKRSRMGAVNNVHPEPTADRTEGQSGNPQRGEGAKGIGGDRHGEMETGLDKYG
ncbi:hypothetical protein IW261DRAFT_1416603 [Armillaria novae-zelandiae]|uniref:Uncharacterized protein n=1 Tax=Armillaria novae-zelandiae TaxID=153914 RepID=A0AA39PI18_9AGAR|nr:hypothetical protein IW261DRAFT_1416603 [Armillaria novae-zelandiae]